MSTALKDPSSTTDKNHFRNWVRRVRIEYTRVVPKWRSLQWNIERLHDPSVCSNVLPTTSRQGFTMSASPPRQASQKKRKRQVVQSEDEEGEYNPAGPFIEVSTPPSLQTNAEKRSVKALKSKPKPRTSITRSSKRGKKAPPSDDESDSLEAETEETEANDEASRKASSKSPSKENVKDKDPDGERAIKKPRLAPGTTGEKLKRQASSASIRPSKKAPNVGASGSGQQTPAKPPPPVGEKKTTSVVSESVGRSALPHRVYCFNSVNRLLTDIILRSER